METCFCTVLVVLLIFFSKELKVFVLANNSLCVYKYYYHYSVLKRYFILLRVHMDQPVICEHHRYYI